MKDWCGDRRRAADVEGAHGELRARLADRLRRDDADRLTRIDGRAAGRDRGRSRCAQTPFLVAQVSTERIFTSWTPAALIFSIWLSSIIVPFGTRTLPSISRHVLGRGATQDADARAKPRPDRRR